ncbi:ACT domain-containing protein [Spirillospora sp. NPDC127200]
MPSQRLQIMSSRFAVEHQPHATFPEDDEWIALVRAPEGLTVVREAPPFGSMQRYAGFYGDPHGLAVPGMLAAIVGPLADAGISVFAVSTYHADLVLVAEESVEEATAVLTKAGHRIVTSG